MKISYFTLTGAITLLFVMAKLLKLIDWSWWIVFLPVIIHLGIGVIVLAVFGGLVIGIVVQEKKKEGK